MKTKDKSDHNAIYLALSDFVKVDQVPHNNSALQSHLLNPKRTSRHCQHRTFDAINHLLQKKMGDKQRRRDEGIQIPWMLAL